MQQPITQAETRPTTSRFAPSVTFRGQLPGEVVVLRTRASWWRVALPAWPLALSVAALLGTSIAAASGRLTGPVTGFLQVVLGITALITLAHCLVTVIFPWWFVVTILTDQRVLLNKGGITVDNRAIPLGRIQEVKIEQRTFREWLFGYGRVSVFTAATDFVTFDNIPRPHIFLNLLMQTHMAPLASSATAELTDPHMRDLVEHLAQGQPLPALPAMDPTLCMNWPLRHAMTAPLAPGETVLGTLSRHWWFLARQEVFPLALLLATAVLTLLAASASGTGTQPYLVAMAIGGGAISFIWALLVYLNFVDDSFVLTNMRLLDINRRYFIFYESTQAIQYKDIQEAKESIPNAWARFQRYGTVTMDVAGKSTPVVFDRIPHPQRIAPLLQQYAAIIKKRDEVAVINREKLEKKEWFVSVLNEMVIAAPELRGMLLEQAIELSYEVGLRLAVLGENVAVPGWPGGIVVSQSPFPGARALRGGDISVMLSRN